MRAKGRYHFRMSCSIDDERCEYVSPGAEEGFYWTDFVPLDLTGCNTEEEIIARMKEVQLIEGAEAVVVEVTSTYERTNAGLLDYEEDKDREKITGTLRRYFERAGASVSPAKQEQAIRDAIKEKFGI